MPASAFVPFLLAGMIITGSSNSLFSKYQDMQCVENCDAPNPRDRVYYEQPVWQTLQMFVGEMFCFLPVVFSWLHARIFLRGRVQLETRSSSESPSKERQLTGWKILLLWIPAACDLTGTTLMNIGLLYTPVSIYQMVRGALVLFVAFFSVAFLKRHLFLYQWFSLFIVILGVGLVGFSGSLVKDSLKESPLSTTADLVTRTLRSIFAVENEGPEATSVVIGIFFIFFAQIFTATQFVVEEKILGRYAVPPLLAVGYEGFFGFITVLIFVPILSIPSIRDRSTFFDLPRGWQQLIHTPSVLWSGVATACSIGLFNYFGLSVTRHVSATVRSLTDTCRTLAIWIISLGLGWEKLLFPVSLLQVLGFALLVYGTFAFNNLANLPPCVPVPRDGNTLHEETADAEEAEGLLASPIDETTALPADLGQSGFDVVPEGQHAIAPAIGLPKQRSD